MNAALALATIEVLQNKIPVSEENIRAGLQSVTWPGRLQLITLPDNRRILLDGAHNVAGAKVLREALEKNSPATKQTLILGVLQDKDWPQICRNACTFGRANFHRARLQRAHGQFGSTGSGLSRGKSVSRNFYLRFFMRRVGEKSTNDDFAVITGSLYLVGEALELLGFSPATGCERALNEWRAAPAS